jgi:arylsulfatase A-like enzyme
MDHCIGSFLDTIKKEDYYNNTIFVFFGDHGLVRNATHMHKSEDQLLLTRYHVPFVLYAPGLINEGKTYDKVASEVDVLPTIASLASIPYVNSTFGKDLLDKKYDEMRYAFTIKHRQGPELGLIGDQFYFFINADKTNRRLHRIYSDIPRENIIEKFPDVAAKMEHLCFGIFETAKYIRFHNSPKEVAGKVELVNP